MHVSLTFMYFSGCFYSFYTLRSDRTVFLYAGRTCNREVLAAIDPEKNDVSSLDFECRFFHLPAGVVLRKFLDSLSSVGNNLYVIRTK